VVSPTSLLVGATLKQADFRNRYGAAVVAIHRAGHRLPGKLGTIPLHAGDVLLVLADPGLGRRLRDHHDFLVVTAVGGEGPVRREKARVVELTILALLVVVGAGWVDILRGTLLAAGTVIALRAVSPVQARRSVDLDVLVMIAASFGLGAAVAASGLAESLAGGITDALGSHGELGLVVAVLLATMAVTELVTNNAAAVLMFPIAMATAAAAGFDPRPFAMTVAVGASASFLTPIGYQTNTMVYGMGGYRFTDFVRAGAPLTLTVLLVTPPVVLAAF
jgi:di/tricarboxylate transporter